MARRNGFHESKIYCYAVEHNWRQEQRNILAHYDIGNELYERF